MERARILAVDDEPAILRLLTLWLSPSYEVQGLSSGADLLQAMEDFRPDLVVMDVSLPEQDGFALCREIRRRSPHGAVPVLFLTARKGDEDFADFLGSRGTAYLAKPAGRRRFLSIVQELLGEGAMPLK